MFVGVGNVHIHIGWAQSLKDKRQVVKSIIHKLRNKFNVSVAEVESQDLWQYCVLGIASVSSSEEIVRSTIDHAVNYIEDNAEVEVVKFTLETV